MNLPVARWYPMIETRRSRRRFEETPLKTSQIKRLQKLCNEFQPFENARAVLVVEPPDNIFKGILGSYGIIKGARAFIAFIGNTRSQRVNEQVGYTGEGIILEVEAMNLNTCWVGGQFKRNLVNTIVELKNNENVYAVSPVGMASKKLGFTERAFSGFGLLHRRKPLSDLVVGIKENQMPAWMKSSLNAARLAPSAVNRQPWRFLVEDKSITIASEGKSLKREDVMSKRLCCGIAMLHLELGSLNYGVSGTWEFLNPPGVARFRITD